MLNFATEGVRNGQTLVILEVPLLTWVSYEKDLTFFGLLIEEELARESLGKRTSQLYT